MTKKFFVDYRSKVGFKITEVESSTSLVTFLVCDHPKLPYYLVYVYDNYNGVEFLTSYSKDKTIESLKAFLMTVKKC